MTSQETKYFRIEEEEPLVLSENDIAELWGKLGPELKTVATRFIGVRSSVTDVIGIAKAAGDKVIRVK